jgi:hypothetical protein
MTNQRGWKDGVYNPGFPPDKAYIERKAKEFAAAGFEWPEIKGVQFKRSKNEHKPMRNVVTRVVMVGFDPFNHSGLPEHIERQVVHDYWSGLEMQFVQDWVNEAPEGEIRFGGMLNLYGDDESYKPFPEIGIDDQRRIDEVDTYFDYAFRSDRVVENGIVKRDKLRPSGVPDEYGMRRQMIESFGLPEHLMKPTLTFSSFANEVCYNGVKLSQIEIPESLNKTRDLVIEITKEVSVEDYPNLLTLFVGRGGNIRDLSDFFMLVKDAAPVPIRREPPVRTREDERGHEECMRDSVRGIFPYMVLEQTAPDRTVDRDHTKLAIKATPEQLEEFDKDSGLVTIFENGEFIPRVTGAYAVGEDGVKRDLRDIDFFGIALGLPEVKPEDKGVVVQVISDAPGDSADYWPPIDILMSQQSMDKRMVRKEEIVFAFAGHTYKQTVFLSPEDVTGLCELYVPVGAVLTNEYGTRPNPIREHWEKHGDPYEGRIPHIAQFADIASSMVQSGRNETMAVHIEPVLTPEEIADREQAIQEASEGKLDYLLEGTQWDPKNRKS